MKWLFDVYVGYWRAIIIASIVIMVVAAIAG